MVLAAVDYPLLGIFWTTLMIFSWVLWLWLLIRVYSDLFSRRDIGGWAKAGWVVVTLLLPLLGVFIYLLSQGRSMAARSQREAERQRAETDEYIRSVASSARSDQLAQARELRDSGALTPEEFDRVVQKVHS